jgi:hypothetical protein
MVDFPAPDSPTRATEDPCGTLKETPFNAVARPSYEKLTFSVYFMLRKDLKNISLTDQIQFPRG